MYLTHNNVWLILTYQPVYHSLDWNTGLSYFRFFTSSVFSCKEAYIFKFDKYVANMDDLVVIIVAYCSVFSNT